MTLISPKLLGSCYQNHSFAIPNEDGALAGCDKDGAVLTVINVEVSSDVEDEEVTVFAILNIVLLLLDGV